MLFYIRVVLQSILAIGMLLFFAPLTAGAQCRPEGTVSDENGRPLAGANVWVAERQAGAVSLTDGRYALPTLPAGRYAVQFSYVGYETQTLELTVMPNAGACPLDARLQPLAVTTDALIVTAVRVDQRAPMTFTTLNRADLQPRNIGQDAPFLMQWTPSAVVTSDAGTGIGYTGIWIRGADPTRTNITINGIPLNDAESQAVFWVNLPDFMSSAEEVQIQRGVGASTNGPGAFGATININTQKVNREAYASLDGTAGSFNTWRGSLRFGTGLIDERFTLDGRLSRITSDGYIDRASADLRAWFLSGAYLGKRSTLRINAFQGAEVTYQAWYGLDAALVEDPATRTFNIAGTEKAGEPYDNEVDDYGQTHLQLLFNHQLNDAWRFNLSGYYTRGAGFFEQYKAGEYLPGYGIAPLGQDTISDLIRRRWLDNHLLGVAYGLHHQHEGSGLQFTLGGAYSRYDGGHFGEVVWARFAGLSEIRHRYYDNDGLKTDFNVFAKVNYPIAERWDLYADLQLRQVGYQFLGLDDQLNRIDQEDRLTFVNPKAGITYQASREAQAYLSFGIARREPNRNDYVDNPPAVRPRPERLYNTELGWRYRTEKLAFEANAYHMYYIDQLALNGQLNDVGEYLRINLARSYRVGLELSGAWQVSAPLSIQANLAVSRNRVARFTEYIDRYDADFNYLGQEAIARTETPLAFSPAVVAAAEMRYAFPSGAGKAGQWETALQGKHVSKRYLDNSGDEGNVIDPYAFADWRLSYRRQLGGKRALRFSFVVQNITDAQLETNGWSYRYRVDEALTVDRGLYPQAGRNWLVAIGADF